MKKIGKILLKTILWIVAVVLALVLTLPLWFGPVGKLAANNIVPGMLGCDFNIGKLYLNPYTTRFETGDIQLANPEGYSEKYAFTLGDLVFDAHTLSLFTDVIHIEEIKIKDVFVSYVDGGKEKVNNFQQIQYNVAGGKENYEAAQAAAEESAQVESQAATPQEPAPETAKEESAPKKVIIDHIHISGIHIQMGIIPIIVPIDLDLHDIGKDTGGSTWEQVGQEIMNAVMKAAGAVGEQLQALGGFMSDSASQAADAAVKATGAAAEAVGNAAGATTEAIGNAAGAATEAVGDAAGKALDSIKKLW